MKQIIFWGATGQAKVLRECLQGLPIRLVALFDNNENLVSPFDDVPLYYGKKGFEKWRSSAKSNNQVGFLAAIGGDRGKDRIEIQEYLESQGLIPLVAKHRTAFVADNAQIGLGSQILAMSAVCVGVKIGRGCIVNTGALVDHECCLGDGVHICPGACLAGCVAVGRYSTIGTGAVVLPRVRIGEGATVGAGAVVMKDIEPYSIVAGNPARVIRRITGEQ
jgi:sugar O-acyltransferase (sialic acid O-acetyltransferase NeuD family)